MYLFAVTNELCRLISECAAISNCEQVACTTAQNQHCMKCKYEYSPDVAGYLPIDDGSYPNRECQSKVTATFLIVCLMVKRADLTAEHKYL